MPPVSPMAVAAAVQAVSHQTLRSICLPLRNAPNAFEIVVAIQFAALALRIPDRFAETFENGVFCVVHFEAFAQGFVSSAYTRRLVDADLVGDGEMQREMQEGVHLSAFRGELLFQCRFRVFEQGVVFGVMLDQVGGGGFCTLQNQTFAMLAPGFAEKTADLLT